LIWIKARAAIYAAPYVLLRPVTVAQSPADENHKVTGVTAAIRDETVRLLEERELKQRFASYEAKSAAASQTSTPGDAKT
jgi:hypothetical protein